VFFRCGLLGEHISYSLSPRICEWGFRACGLAGEYRLYDLPQARARMVAQGSGWDGLNVTIPYKTVALNWCEQMTERAQQVGAVNVLLRKKGVVWGDNTDTQGCQFALKPHAGLLGGVRRALVIGSGGAARAVLLALANLLTMPQLFVASRDPGKATARLGCVAAITPGVRCLSLSQAAEQLDSFDIVVQATPVEVPLPEPLRFRRGALVMDLMYVPPKTRFLRAAECSGARIENGLVMLVAQAAASFEIWTGHVFPLERALKELLPEIAAT
jgi:shikimate dehydrogenase